MPGNRTNVRLNDKCMEDLERIRTSRNLKSLTAAIELAAAEYVDSRQLIELQAATDAKLDLLKKYTNELRRSEYLVIGLLNAITLKLDISDVPPHHDKVFRSPALQSAHNHLDTYMNEILTRNRERAMEKEAQNE